MFAMNENLQARIVMKTYSNDVAFRHRLTERRTKLIAQYMNLMKELAELDSQLNMVEKQISEVEPVARHFLERGYA